jgi:hypothetical protein
MNKETQTRSTPVMSDLTRNIIPHIFETHYLLLFTLYHNAPYSFASRIIDCFMLSQMTAMEDVPTVYGGQCNLLQSNQNGFSSTFNVLERFLNSSYRSNVILHSTLSGQRLQRRNASCGFARLDTGVTHRYIL